MVTTVAEKAARRWINKQSSSIYYHGTPKKFKSFEIQKHRHTFGDKPSDTPLFFTPEEKFARDYAGYQGTIFKVQLNWKKIFDSENLVKSSSKYWPPIREEMTAEGQKLYDDLAEDKIFQRVSTNEDGRFSELLKSILLLHYDVVESSQFKKWLVKNSYDAFYLKGDGEKNVGVFSPKQITILNSYPAYTQ